MICEKLLDAPRDHSNVRLIGQPTGPHPYRAASTKRPSLPSGRPPQFDRKGVFTLVVVYS